MLARRWMAKGVTPRAWLHREKTSGTGLLPCRRGGKENGVLSATLLRKLTLGLVRRAQMGVSTDRAWTLENVDKNKTGEFQGGPCY